MPPADFSRPQDALAHLHQLPTPETAAEVREQLNVLQRAIALIDPSSPYEEEILDALRTLVEIQGGGLEDGAGTPSTPQELLAEIALKLEEQIQGVTDTTDLPAGLTGQAAATIRNGQEGVATFDIAGGEFAAEVQAVETVDVQDILRVLPQGRNLVESVGVRRTEEFIRPTVLAVADQLHVANQRYDRGDRVDVVGTLNPGEEKVMAEVTLPGGVSFMFTGTNATAHPDAEYRYFFDQAGVLDEDLDPSDADPNLSGTAPWATPPDLFSPYDHGPVEVRDSVKLQVANESDSTELETVQGTLAGYLVEVPE